MRQIITSPTSPAAVQCPAFASTRMRPWTVAGVAVVVAK
jgi:hypothetical protein